MARQLIVLSEGENDDLRIVGIFTTKKRCEAFKSAYALVTYPRADGTTYTLPARYWVDVVPVNPSTPNEGR